MRSSWRPWTPNPSILRSSREPAFGLTEVLAVSPWVTLTVGLAILGGLAVGVQVVAMAIDLRRQRRADEALNRARGPCPVPRESPGSGWQHAGIAVTWDQGWCWDCCSVTRFVAPFPKLPRCKRCSSPALVMRSIVGETSWLHRPPRLELE